MAKRQGSDKKKKKRHTTFLKEDSLDDLRQFIPSAHGQHKINVWENTKCCRQRAIRGGKKMEQIYPFLFPSNSGCSVRTQVHVLCWTKLTVNWSVKDRRAQTLGPERLLCWTAAKVTWGSALGLLVCARCVYALHAKLYCFNILYPNNANFHRRQDRNRGKEQEKGRQTDSTSGLSSIGSRETQAGSAGGHLTGPPLLPHIFSLRLHSKTERQEEGWRKWLHLVWFWQLSTGRSASVHWGQDEFTAPHFTHLSLFCCLLLLLTSIILLSLLLSS